jgi:NTP pyrophosphatase (non-canonical NTP hydrolase)
MNGLNPIERELLTMLAEEASEVVQAVTKILRHGPTSWNPDDPDHPSNKLALRKELIDMLAVIQMMREAYTKPLLGVIAAAPSPSELGDAMRRKQRWMHHSMDEDSKED